MEWNGKELNTAHDVMGALEECVDAQEANTFVDFYRSHHPEVADDNLKFGIAYFTARNQGEERANELYQWLGLNTTVEQELQSLYS